MDRPQQSLLVIHIQCPTSRLVRLASRLQEYTLAIVRKAGKARVDGDCLSRLPPEVEVPVQLHVWLQILSWADSMLYRNKRKILLSPL